MATFNLPRQSDIPSDLQAEIDASVRRFEEQWGLMLAYAKANGYIENYRTELTARVTSAYNAGKASR